jgi:hypothetical protein
MATAADADALDALLRIQLKLVEQQIRESLAKPKLAPAAPTNSMPLTDTIAAKQSHLRALDAQNAALERELAAAAAAARPRGSDGSHARQQARVMPAHASDDAELRRMLRESVQMHRELMQDVRAETEELKQQWQRWGDANGDEEDSDTDIGWPKELDDVPNTNSDPYASFGGTLPAHPPPMQAQPSDERGAGGALGESRRVKGKGAASELQDELLSEINQILEQTAVSSDSDAPSEKPLTRRRPGSAGDGSPSQDDQSAPPRTAGSRPRTRGSSVVTEEEEEEEEEPAPSDEDVRLALEALYESASGWLKRAMRPVVSSIVRDQTLKLDVWASEAVGDGVVGRMLGRKPGLPKPADEEKACSKIRIRAKSILEVITEAIPDAPGTVLSQLFFLTTRRFKWPENTLLPSVEATLDVRDDGTATPTHRSAVAVVLQLLIVRLVCEELLLRPNENQLAGKLTFAAQSNLKMVASFLFILFEMCMARTDDHTRIPELIAVEQQAIGQALTQYYNNPHRFQPQLERLCTFGLPLLSEWLREAPAVLENVARLLLQAAQERENSQAAGAAMNQQK